MISYKRCFSDFPFDETMLNIVFIIAGLIIECIELGCCQGSKFEPFVLGEDVREKLENMVDDP